MALSFDPDPCAKCEELMQPYLDRDLGEEERAEAERHLDGCSYCRKRYKFEVELRRFVRQAVVEDAAAVGAQPSQAALGGPAITTIRRESRPPGSGLTIPQPSCEARRRASVAPPGSK
jgi:anti-sigma factor RsiW